MLERVVDRLRPIPARRKAIIWFSRGGELPANFETNLEIGQPIGRNEDALRSVIDRARAANVAIYTVDPRGLVTGGKEVPGSPSTSGRDNPGGYDFEDVGTLRDLATATGGRAIVARQRHRWRAAGASRSRIAPTIFLATNRRRATERKGRRRARFAWRPGRLASELLHRSLYLPGSGATNVVPELIASPLARARSADRDWRRPRWRSTRRKRGLLLPFEIGTRPARRHRG